jgi:CzcA family heavy metal efflux pump
VNPYDLIHRYRKAFLFLLSFIVIAGLAFALRMPVSLFPDINFPRIVLLADNGEQPAERMMAEVTKPLEEAVNSVPGVNLVRSITSRGSAEISITLDWSTNVKNSLQSIQGRITDIRNTLPASASVQAIQMNVSIFPIQEFSLTSDSISQISLRDLALYQIRPALMRIHGVAQVQVIGGDIREFQVTVAPEKLESYGLTITQISDALQKRNLIKSSGLVNNNHFTYLSLISGVVSTVEEIESVTIAVRNNVPIKVADIAQVKPGIAANLIRTTANGKPAVLISIIKQPTGSSVAIGKEITNTLRSIQIPQGVFFANTYDQSDFINHSISNTRDSIAIGIVLAMLVLLSFLGSWRITLVAAIMVPATISAALLALFAMGNTINIMTLGGIAASVGLIIDDAIVIMENIFTRFSDSKLHHESGLVAFSHAANRTLREMMPAIIGSTMSTIVIQIPLLFLSGITGSFFKPLSITMIFALLISFILSISLVPLLTSWLYSEEDINRESVKSEHRSKRYLQYASTLHWLLPRRMLVIPGAFILLTATFFLYTQVESGFMPEMDEGAFVLDYTAPPGTSLIDTDRMLKSVETILMKIPEVESYSRRTGTQLGFFITESNTGDFLVKLKTKRSRNVDEIINEVRNKVLTAQPSLSFEFGQLIMDVIGDLVNGPAPVEIKLFGDNIKILHAKAKEVTRLIEKVPGTVDVFNGMVITGPSFIINIDERKAALAGLSTSDVHDQMAAIMQGAVASQIQHGEKLLDVRVLFPTGYRTDFEQIQNTNLVNSSGKKVLLSSIALFDRTAGNTELDREGQRQMITITSRISGRDLGHTMQDIKQALSARLVLPKGFSLSYGGIYQTQQESFSNLLIVAFSSIMLVFVVLLFEFREFAVPVSILIIAMLSLFGSFLALFITHIALNISSFVGIILIIGIVAENAIFLLHTVKVLEEKEHMDLDEALIQACQKRTRPIFMTTLGAILAFLPLALGIGAGTQMQQPLAIAIIGGFSVSSFLLFFGLPLVYRLLRR